MKLDAFQTLNPALLGQKKPDLDMQRIDETAKDFEAMFVTEMLRPMFEDIKPDETFGGGKGEEVFSGFMIEEYGKSFAAAGNLGIADLVKAQLIEMQSGTQKGQVAQNMQGSAEVKPGETIDVQ